MFIPSPQQVFGRSNILVLVEGLDYDYTSKDEEFSTNSRSDVIWAVNLDFATKRIYQLSVPRDMVATMPNGTRAKINQAQSDGGVNEAKSVIAQFLGIPGFDRYVILRIDATKAFVDAIGGIEVDVKSSDCLKYKTGCTGESLQYDDSWGHLHIHLKQGPQHLNGEQAVAYMRFRHDWCSDPCRIMRQQQVLHAMATKLRSDKINTFMHLGDLLNVFRKYVQTDFSDQELLAVAAHYEGIPDSAIVNNQVPYTGRHRLAGIRRLAASRRGSAHAAGERDAARAARSRALARRDGAGGDRAGNAAGRRAERQRHQRRGAARRRLGCAGPDSRSAT